MKRIAWQAFGLFTQMLFVVTVWRLFPFLRGGGQFRGLLSPAPSPAPAWFMIDGLLATQFAATHSILLLPSVRRALTRWVPQALYGCLFCTATCVGLLLTMETWQPCDGALWRAEGRSAVAIDVAFLLTWAALFYSLWLTGLGYQTGLAPWWAYVRGREVPRREFGPRGAYRVLRHPVYLCFLGLIWFNPLMTFDRLILALAWTAHVFVGSYLKDRRLVFYLGETYRAYQRLVPGYPFITFGPLGKLRT
jgi:hypothetical protein